MLDIFLTEIQSDDFATSYEEWLKAYEMEMTEDEIEQEYIQEKSRRTSRVS